MARDRAGVLCGRCAAAQAARWAAPPVVPVEFWEHPPLVEAFAARHMGRVVRAYRHHPWHGGHGVPQPVVGEWLHMTQTQISRLETGKARKHLDWLTFAARTLRIPAELLWFQCVDEPPGVVPTLALDDGGARAAAMTGGGATRSGRRLPGAGQRQFCADLRYWRVLRAWSQRDLAERVTYSREWVALVERGERWPTEDFARRADAALQTGGVLLSRWPAVEAEWAAMPSRQPRPLAPVLPLRRPDPDRAVPAVPVAADPLSAMVVDVLRACPGARVVVLAMDGGVPGPLAAGGGDGHAAVVDLAARRRANGDRR